MPGAYDFPEISRLLRSNSQWAADVHAAEPEFFKNSANGQAPNILWIGCADSRAPESVVLAAKPGEIFVHRNIANQVHHDDESAAAVMWYAIHALGVRHVVIAGHTKCGGAAACAAAVTAGTNLVVPGAGGIEHPINAWLAPLVKIAETLGPKPDLDRLVDESVKAQVSNAAGMGPITSAWEKGLKVYIHGWVYHLESGQLRDLNVTVSPPA